MMTSPLPLLLNTIIDRRKVPSGALNPIVAMADRPLQTTTDTRPDQDRQRCIDGTRPPPDTEEGEPLLPTGKGMTLSLLLEDGAEVLPRLLEGAECRHHHHQEGGGLCITLPTLEADANGLALQITTVSRGVSQTSGQDHRKGHNPLDTGQGLPQAKEKLNC